MSAFSPWGARLNGAIQALGRTWEKHYGDWLEHARLPGSSRAFRRDIPRWTKAYETARGYVLIARHPTPGSIELAGALPILAIILILVWCYNAINWAGNFGAEVVIAGLACVVIAVVGPPLLSVLLVHTLKMRFENGWLSWRSGWRRHKVPLDSFDIRRIEHKDHTWRQRSGKTKNLQEAYEVIINSGRSKAIAMRVTEISSVDAAEAALQLTDVIRFLKDRAIERAAMRSEDRR